MARKIDTQYQKGPKEQEVAMNEKLKTEHVKLDPREALQASPAILLGVTQAGAAALFLT